MELPVLNPEGQQVGTVEVRAAPVAAPMNYAVVHQATVAYQANRRQGTHATKTRGLVSGGGRKPWGQKYTGRARQGSIRAPQWRHGGVVFGPQPRDYRQELPRRLRHLALRCVLSAKVREGKVTVLERFDVAQPSTKAMARVLANLGVTTSALLVHSGAEPAVVPSARNLPRVRTLPARLLNAWELLHHDRVVITVEALRQAEELWAQARPRPRGRALAEAVEP